MSLNTFFVIAIIGIVFLIVVVAFSYVTVNATAPSPEKNTPPATVKTSTEPVLINTQVIYDIPLSQDLQIATQDVCLYRMLDYELVFAVMQVESNFDEKAYNPISKCIGLMQINPINIPELYKILRIQDLENPYDNIDSGVYLLQKCFKQSKGNINYALMIYNCGANKAKQLWDEGVTETDYTRKVLEAKENLKIKEKIYYKEVIEIEHYN